LQTPLTVKQNERFSITPGSSIHSVASKLHARGILAHPNFFVLLAFLEGNTKHIKAGEYQIEPGTTPKKLLIKLVKGQVLLHPLTIVEGWTLKQVLLTTAANPYLVHTVHTVNLDILSQKLGNQEDNLEGFLYPDTYLFAAGVNDIVILHHAFSTMQRYLDKAWQQRAAGLPYQNTYQALIVASLIEKETARPEERAKIAGVIIRRLQKHMLLQIDASVIYGLGELYTGKLTASDLKKENPYNTYLRKGLPPTPIAMPSSSSIQAALHPALGDELYYVAKGDGSHEFTNTLTDHHKAIQQYRIQHLEVSQPQLTQLPKPLPPKEKEPKSTQIQMHRNKLLNHDSTAKQKKSPKHNKITKHVAKKHKEAKTNTSHKKKSHPHKHSINKKRKSKRVK
jgi:UPF0755 protein